MANSTNEDITNKANMSQNVVFSSQSVTLPSNKNSFNLSSDCDSIFMMNDCNTLSASHSHSIGTPTAKTRRQLQFPSTSTPKHHKVKWEDSPSLDISSPLTFLEKSSGSISDDLITHWITCLEKDFKPSLCLEVFEYMMKNYKCPSLTDQLDKVLSTHFRIMVKSDDFLKVKFDFVTHLLQLDELYIDSEVEVFNAAMRWLTCYWNERKEFVPFVLGCVRFGEMTKQECADIFVKLDTEDLGLLTICQDLLFQPMVYQLTQDTCHNQQFAHLAPRPRINLRSVKRNSAVLQITSTKDTKAKDDAAILDISIPDLHSKLAIVCFGGQSSVRTWDSSEAGFGIVGFKLSENKWKQIGKLPESRSYLAATILTDRIYISGGYDPQLTTDCANLIIKDTFWCHNIKGSGWQLLSPMNFARAHHSMVSTHNRIYVIGGQGKKGIPLDTVEYYDINVRFWKEASPLPMPCLGMAVCEYRGNIWICGGVAPVDHSPSHGRIMDTVLIYDPIRNLCRFGVPLRIPRAFANLVEFEGNLLIIGGITTTGEFNTGVATEISVIDCFSFHSQKWGLKSDLMVPRHSTMTAVTGQRFYVLGGISAGIARDDVECYDERTHEWRTDAPPLQLPLYGAACVVLPIPV